MIRRLSTFICILLSVVALHGQGKEELSHMKQKAFDEIKLARELMEKTRDQKAGSVQQLRLLQHGINSRANLISTLESEIDLLDADIEEVKKEIGRLEKENEKNREEYARLIYYAYRNHSDYEKLMYILAGASISQSYQRYKYLKYISEYRVGKAAQIEELVSQLENKNKEFGELRNEKLRLLESKDQEQRKLIGERERKASLVQQLSTKEKELKKEIEEKERIARELEAKIRAIIEEEARKANATNIYAALTPEQEILGNDFKRNKGKIPYPVERGIIGIGFGDNEVEGLRGSSVNNIGIDLYSAPGTKVRAVFEGEVKGVFFILGANYNVLIRHGEYLTLYQNLTNVRVKTGDKVLTKEVLGDAFVDGDEDIAKMHFEIWREKEILNPELWLSK